MIEKNKIITTEDIKEYQKLFNQKILFYVLFMLFWLLTLLCNHSFKEIMHDALFMTTIVLIIGLYFTHHEMREVLR